jgi:hypothetical protein
LEGKANKDNLIDLRENQLVLSEVFLYILKKSPLMKKALDVKNIIF